MTAYQKRIVMTRVDPSYSGAKMTPSKNPAFSAEDGSDTAFVCPSCSAVLGEFVQGYVFKVPVQCADCGTLSMVPDSFWKSVGAP